MLKTHSYFLMALMGWLLSGPFVMADDGVKGNLVTVRWLEKNLKNPDVVILDASPYRIYSTKHIPGSFNHDIFNYGNKEMSLPEIEKRYQSWGISRGKKIVIYDQGGTYLATRLFFSLEYYGFPAKDIFILDGGLSKWEEAGLPVTKEIVSASVKGSFTIKNPNEDIKAELPEFLVASGDTRNHVLLEALDAGWHFGGLQFFSKPGHIPNAVMLPTADFYNPDKTLKSTDEIERMLRQLGVSPQQRVYTHCGGGIAASLPYFALKHMLNYPQVKLYQGSQLEWLSDERELPFWTYDAPFLLRETSWLQGWSGRMLRMYGVSEISIIDVRPAEQFGQGHLPFALNIPVSSFRNTINDPAHLAKILGPAGVDVSHEAVVVSGGGVTKESALAFVLLERAGQKKVSIFMDSLEKSSQAGFALTKDATVVAAKKGPGDLSISPTAYPPIPRNNIVISDPNTTRGYYPKLFIDAGVTKTMKTYEGTVVHIPYVDLLSPDGRPKAAKDIWDILAKAGVSRYAELVCFSDDPGEAAVNYFILKLMGFPDLKILVL